jgi:UDP-N-acetylglucosamine 2-epimerase (hydrolysing)
MIMGDNHEERRMTTLQDQIARKIKDFPNWRARHADSRSTRMTHLLSGKPNKHSQQAARKRHIVFVTGTRADFGKLEPLIVSARDQGFRVSIFITGMHLLERYGMTKIEVHRVQGVSFYEFPNQADFQSQDIILSNTVCGFSSYVQREKPNLVIVHGDRIEALACAIVCATQYIRCGHVEGGEVSGTIDEALRHCNTKLAHHHFVSSGFAANRVRRLGESNATIHVIGSPELDYHLRPSGVALGEVKRKYEINFDNFGICIFHPVTSEQKRIHRQVETLFDALEAVDRQFVVLLPNNDPGADIIIQRIQSLPADRFRVLPSMRFTYFSELLRNAACIVGNSSTGVREAPFLGIPSLNFGTRQNGRFTGASITNAGDLDQDTIRGFLANEWGKTYPQDHAFGCGNAAANFVSILNEPSFWVHDLQKQFADQI